MQPPPQSHGTALGVVLLGAIGLAVAWVGWRLAVTGPPQSGVHVFQYCLLLVIAAFLGAAVAARSGYVLLALAGVGTLLAWLGLTEPRLLAALVGGTAIGCSAYAAFSRARWAAVVAVLTIIVSLLGLLLIL